MPKGYSNLVAAQIRLLGIMLAWMHLFIESIALSLFFYGSLPALLTLESSFVVVEVYDKHADKGHLVDITTHLVLMGP